jgi:hypothetical protein
MIMKSLQITHTENLQKYTRTIANKMNKGFVIIENNEKLPFAVLSKEGFDIHRGFNFLFFCATLGLWSFPWIYMSLFAPKEKMILIAIDEDGNTFEQRCRNYKN